MGPRAMHRTGGSRVPASTKFVVAFALLLIVGSVLLAIWQRIAPSSEGTVVQTDSGGETIPGLGVLLPVAGVVVVLVCIAAVFVLSRSKGSQHR